MFLHPHLPSAFAIRSQRCTKHAALYASHHGICHDDFIPNNDDDDDEDEDEDDNGDAPIQKPYRNRSLAWTNRYRALLPYERARAKVIAMGFYSKEDWDDYVMDGKKDPYLPNHPDEMYATEWTSWEEFLGLMRNYEDARTMVQHVLAVQTMEEYTRFIESDPQRAAQLRLPLKPHIVYQGKGWVNNDHFFGTMQ